MAENVDYSIKVYDNRIEITPEGGVKDNSIYEIMLSGIKQLNGNKELKFTTVKICTAMTPMYTTLDAINSLISSCGLDDAVILYHSREASRFVEYLTGQSYKKKGEIPFDVTQCVRYKAAYECVLKYYVDRTTDSGLKGQLGDVQFQTDGKLADISDLLKRLKEEMDYWIAAVQGYGKRAPAKPVSAVKSGYITSARTINDSPPSRSYMSGGTSK